MTKRVLAMALAILAFFIFVGSPFQQAAEAIAGVDDAIIAIVIAALAALGITFTTTGVFNNLKEYVGDLMQQYALSQSTTVYDQMRGTQTASNSLGQILLNNRFVRYLDGFAAFVILTLGLANNENKRVVSSANTLAGMEIYSLPVSWNRMNGQDGYIFEQYISASNVYAIGAATSPNSGTFVFISNQAGSVVNKLYVDSSGHVSLEGQLALTSRGQYLYWELARSTANTDYYDFPYARYDYVTVMNAIDSYDISTGSLYDVDVSTETMVLPSQDEDYAPGDGAILDVDSVWGMDYGGIVDDSIPEGYEGSEIFYETETEIQDQVTDTPQQVISQEVADYQTPGLQDVFPFCIPFDIYAFFECMAAEPEAPAFTWRFYIPGICDEEIEIDLAAFDSAARILRTMELLLFIVGLAFVTRDKFLRG